jgi:hypothetical protein
MKEDPAHLLGICDDGLLAALSRCKGCSPSIQKFANQLT